MNAFVGVLLNFLIIEFYDSEILGFFNISYSIYIVLSQLCVFGLQNSILYQSSKYFNNSENLKLALSSTILILVILSGLILLGLWIVRWLFIPLYDFPDQAEKALTFLFLATFFFSLNKVFIFFLNGIKKLFRVAFMNGLRAILLITFFIGLIKYEAEGQYLSSIFLFSEITLFIVAIILTKKYLFIPPLKKLFEKSITIIKYGKSAFLGTLLADIYLKIDVLVLGFFLSDQIVGHYSFVAFFFEGFNQLALIIRISINPKLPKFYSLRTVKKAKQLLIKEIRSYYVLFTVIGSLTIICFPFIVSYFSDYNLTESWVIYIILTAGGIIYSGINPVIQIFNQSNKPNQQTLFWFIVFLINLTFNIIFIQFWGIYGAAIATAITFAFKPFFYFKLLQKIGIDISLQKLIRNGAN